MKIIQEKIYEFKALPEKKQKLLLAGLLFLIIPSTYIGVMFVPGGIRFGFWKSLLYGIFTRQGRINTIIAYLILLGIALYALFRKGIINPVVNEDKKGVKFLQDGTFGSGNWMNKEEAKEVFTVGNINSVKEQIYGQFTDEGREVVAFKENKAGGNQNTFMIGSPGTGKSFGFVRTAVIQAILRGESVCITDPSSELFTDLAQFAKDRGAQVKVLNFVNPEYSDAWDCLNECINPETGRLEALRLQEWCDIFMRNTVAVYGPEKNTDFWADSALNLMQAVIGYTAYIHETETIKAYRHLIESTAKLVDMSQETLDGYRRECGENANLNRIKSLYVDLALAVGYSQDEVDQIIKEAEEHITPFTIGEIYQAFLNFGSLEAARKRFEKLPFDHPGSISFMTFDRDGVKESVKASAQQGVLLRFKIFMDPEIRRITSNSNINIEEMGRKQTICFLITPDNSDAMKSLQALFFSFLIKDISDAYDKRQAECEKLGIKNERLPVNVIMDEAYSNGYIANFGTALATTRKRKLYITMIWQTIGQVIEMYGENMAETLKSCCDILVFLGTGDLKTARYVSEFSGSATVRARSHTETTSGLFFGKGAVTEINASESQKPVMTVDDVLAVNNEVIVIRRGYQHILKLNRFGFIEHPVYKKGLLKKSSIFDYPKATDIYTAPDSIRGNITLEKIHAGHTYKARDKSIDIYITKKIELPKDPEARAKLHIEEENEVDAQEVNVVLSKNIAMKKHDTKIENEKNVGTEDKKGTVYFGKKSAITNIKGEEKENG